MKDVFQMVSGVCFSIALVVFISILTIDISGPMLSSVGMIGLISGVVSIIFFILAVTYKTKLNDSRLTGYRMSEPPFKGGVLANMKDMAPVTGKESRDSPILWIAVIVICLILWSIGTSLSEDESGLFALILLFNPITLGLLAFGVPLVMLMIITHYHRTKSYVSLLLTLILLFTVGRTLLVVI